VKQAQTSGLGEDPKFTVAPPPNVVDAAKTAISPWLWVFSVVGFGLALLNTRRISKIYGGYQAGRRALRRGEVPSV